MDGWPAGWSTEWLAEWMNGWLASPELDDAEPNWEATFCGVCIGPEQRTGKKGRGMPRGRRITFTALPFVYL